MRSTTGNICRTLAGVRTRRVHTLRGSEVRAVNGVPPDTRWPLLHHPVSPRIQPVLKFRPTWPGHKPSEDKEEVDDTEWDLRVGKPLGQV